MSRLRDAGRRVLELIAPTLMGSFYEMGALRRRVDALEQELHEARRLNLRAAQLLDVVAELLLPAASRDDERLREVLDKYADTL